MSLSSLLFYICNQPPKEATSFLPRKRISCSTVSFYTRVHFNAHYNILHALSTLKVAWNKWLQYLLGKKSSPLDHT